jgi:hypothetical protein
MQRKYPHAEISLSCPRLCPIINNDKINPKDVDERKLTQIICAYRLFMPYACIVVSSRESARYRNAIMKIAATKVSGQRLRRHRRPSGKMTAPKWVTNSSKSLTAGPLTRCTPTSRAWACSLSPVSIFICKPSNVIHYQSYKMYMTKTVRDPIHPEPFLSYIFSF